MTNRVAIGLIAFGLCMSVNAVAADLVAVVSSKISVTSLTPSQLADIYLGRSSRFPDGTPAIPCDLSEDSPLREAFYMKVVGKSPAQVKAHWSKLIFTGRGQPPREVATSGEAKKLVIDNPGVICYMEKALVDRNLTVVFTP